ncbi:MAG: polysaccharide deacetylase family protein, partial [Hyphomicrobiaceae bacterium]|nr:polysaccharide deacetylase family protein [Hyphomicrobiaceae bacterium]
MRTIGGAVFLCCALAGVLQPAYAQEACAPGAGKLGVARTLAVNAANGPHFGAQYKSSAFLADGEVVLTFDDGPSRAYTRAILDTLAAQCTKATFFMLGQMALADPQLVKEVARQGHTVATHTWSHANLQVLPQDKVVDEIELGLSSVQHALGKPVAPFFRFPYLRDTPPALNHLKTRQLAVFGIDIDSRDFETKDTTIVLERVLRELAARRKGILLFHDIHASTARALPRILQALNARGFRVVHVVPKSATETLAQYDALAQEAAERRRVAATNPLAKRA